MIDYQSIMENAVGGIFVSTTKGDYLVVNDALAEIYGYSSSEELINNLTDIAHQLYVDSSVREKFINSVSISGQLENFEAEIFTKNGGRKWISESVRQVQNEKGEVLYYEGFVTDITDLVRYRRTIEEQNHRLSELNINLEHKVEQRTKTIDKKKKQIEEKNEQLSNLVDELTRVKVTRQATSIALIITIILFVLTEGYVEPVIENNFKNEFYISLGLKGLIALLIKPIEMLVEKFLIRSKSKKILARTHML